MRDVAREREGRQRKEQVKEKGRSGRKEEKEKERVVLTGAP